MCATNGAKVLKILLLSTFFWFVFVCHYNIHKIQDTYNVFITGLAFTPTYCFKVVYTSFTCRFNYSILLVT